MKKTTKAYTGKNIEAAHATTTAEAAPMTNTASSLVWTRRDSFRNIQARLDVAKTWAANKPDYIRLVAVKEFFNHEERYNAEKDEIESKAWTVTAYDEADDTHEIDDRDVVQSGICMNMTVIRKAIDAGIKGGYKFVNVGIQKGDITFTK